MTHKCLDVEPELRRLCDHVSTHSQTGSTSPCCTALIDEAIHLAYVKGRTAGILETSESLREAHRHGRAEGIREATNYSRANSAARGSIAFPHIGGRG